MPRIGLRDPLSGVGNPRSVGADSPLSRSFGVEWPQQTEGGRPMNALYKFTAHLLVQTVWMRYSQQIKIASGLGLASASLLVGGYLVAKRETPEG